MGQCTLLRLLELFTLPCSVPLPASFFFSPTSCMICCVYSQFSSTPFVDWCTNFLVWTMCLAYLLVGYLDPVWLHFSITFFFLFQKTSRTHLVLFFSSWKARRTQKTVNSENTKMIFFIFSKTVLKNYFPNQDALFFGT